MIREFNLVTRIAYTSVVAGAILASVGIYSPKSIFGIGLLVFIQSFIFQYVAFHPTLKELDNKKGRVLLLLVFLVISVVGFFYTCWQIPNIQDFKKFRDFSAYLSEVAFWSALASVCAGMFVAVACMRRAFERYKAL